MGEEERKADEAAVVYRSQKMSCTQREVNKYKDAHPESRSRKKKKPRGTQALA